MPVINLMRMTLGDAPESSYCDSSDSGRKVIRPEDLRAPKVPPRILLVDDNPAFGKIMQRAADKLGVTLIFCENLTALERLQQWSFDVALVDYNLGEINGFELTEYLEKCSDQEIPVILVSQTKQSVSRDWPVTMREFVHKTLGPFAILDAAFEAYEVHRILEHMRTGKHPECDEVREPGLTSIKRKRRLVS